MVGKSIAEASRTKTADPGPCAPGSAPTDRARAAISSEGVPEPALLSSSGASPALQSAPTNFFPIPGLLLAAIFVRLPLVYPRRKVYQFSTLLSRQSASS